MLTPERRAELRVRAEFAKPVVGFGFVDRDADVILTIPRADEIATRDV